MKWTVVWSRPTGRHGCPRPAVSSRMLAEKEKRWVTRGREATCAGQGLNCPSAPTWSVALLPLKVRKLVSNLLWYSEVAGFCFFFFLPALLCCVTLNWTQTELRIQQWGLSLHHIFDSSVWCNQWVHQKKPPNQPVWVLGFGWGR